MTRARRLVVVREIAGSVRDGARRSDVMVVAAAMTTYAVFGLVPLLAIGTRVAGALFGGARVTHTARMIARYLRGPLRLDVDVVAFAHVAVTASWWTIVVALIPVSLYAEGIVRSLTRFARAPGTQSRALRGRMLTPVLTVFVTLAVVLAVGPLNALLGPFGTGLGPRLLGVFVAFNLLFFAFFAALLLVYGLFAATRLRRRALVIGAFAAASWISGQLIGYTIALRYLAGFDHAFGGYAAAGRVAAIAFLVYLEHLVFVGGYLLALAVHERS